MLRKKLKLWNNFQKWALSWKTTWKAYQGRIFCVRRGHENVPNSSSSYSKSQSAKLLCRVYFTVSFSSNVLCLCDVILQYLKATCARIIKWESLFFYCPLGTKPRFGATFFSGGLFCVCIRCGLTLLHIWVIYPMGRPDKRGSRIITNFRYTIYCN